MERLALLMVCWWCMPCHAEDKAGDTDSNWSSLTNMSAWDALRTLKSDGMSPEDLFAANDKERSLLRYQHLAEKLKESIAREPHDDLFRSRLVEWYGFFSKDTSTPGLLLADAAKRHFLEILGSQMIANPKRCTELLAESGRTAVSVSSILYLRKPGPLPFTEENMNSSLDIASQAVWYSHGYTNRIDGTYGYGDVVASLMRDHRDLTPSSVLKTDDRVALTLRLLRTERFRVICLAGLAEFLLRGGKIETLSPRDMRPFRQVFPGNDWMLYSFPPTATRFLTPSDILSAAGRPLGRPTSGSDRLSADAFN